VNPIGRFPRKALQGKPEAYGRITRQQKQMPSTKHPYAGLPLRAVLAVAPLNRQHKADRLPDSPFKNASQPLAFLRIFELII
jgi:hypothetical protein